jgi:hypothetical protein
MLVVQLIKRTSSTPEWEKWHSRLQLFRRAIVISEITISRNAEKVEKTPNFSGWKPNPEGEISLHRNRQ